MCPVDELEAIAATPLPAPPGLDDLDPGDPLVGGRWVAARFVAHLAAGLAAHPDARADAVEALAAGIARSTAGACREPVVLDLAATAAIEGWPADEAAERRAAALRTFARPERVLELLRANPALALLLCDRARLALHAGRELLARLRADGPAVRAGLLGGADPGAIVGLRGVGDRHDGGRRVTRVSFASGATVLLKPRSLAVDLAYAGLLRALAERGLDPVPQIPPTLATGVGHGWQLEVTASSCASVEQVDRAFHRLGAQLAVLHALRATDLHQENLVACGEHPVAIDLETLLQPRLGGADADVADPLLGEVGPGSVLRVGVLPRPDGPLGADIAGLGRDPAARADVSDGGAALAARTGDLAIVGGRLRAGPNAIRLHGEPVRPVAHVDALARGFADAYDLLVAHREELLRPGGALDAFARLEVRVLLRTTQAYTALLERQIMGACLVSGQAREEALAPLESAARHRSDLRAAAPAERDDLWVGDVPRLTARPGEPDLHHHAHGRIAGALAPEVVPGPDVVRRLGADDRALQLSLLRTAVVAAAAGPPPPGRAPAPAAAPTPDALEQAADRVGARLAALALRDGDRAGWLVLVDRRAPREGRVLARAGRDVADGVAGIRLALEELARRRGDAGAAELARAATRGLPEDHEEDVTRTASSPGDLLALVDPDAPATPAAAAAAALALRATGGPDALRRSGALAAQVVAATAADDLAWGGVETPELRDGLAGVLLALLALAAPGDPAAVVGLLARARSAPRRSEAGTTVQEPFAAREQGAA